MQGLLDVSARLLAERFQATIEVQEVVGDGTEGEVYRVLMKGKQYAVKWYYPEMATPERRAALTELIKRGTPSDRFLWPIDLVSDQDQKEFGYLMPWREERFKSIAAFLRRRVRSHFRAMCTAGFELAHHFFELHIRGLCYRDISLGNLAFDPATGEIRISDNDNVGVNRSSVAFVYGTPEFMAPEIVRGETNPSIDTDLFSLAVLLFELLVQDHPLEGAREAAIHSFNFQARRKLYGDEPIFIFDPHDPSNRPVHGIHNNALIFWPLYPQSLQNLFTRAFTAGLRNTRARVIENEWRDEMIRLRDSLIYCSHCGAQNFYHPEKLRLRHGHICWSCQWFIDLPFRLQVNKQVVMLNYDTQLFPHHLDPQRPYDFSQPMATVAQHPSNPSIWGLKNLSPQRWRVIQFNGSTQEVLPGRSATLTRGLRFQFGKVDGEVRL